MTHATHWPTWDCMAERWIALPADHNQKESTTTMLTCAKIRELFDQNPDLRVADLARIAGKSISQIKRILMSEG